MRRVLIVNPGASRVTEARLAAVERVLAPIEIWRTERSGHGVDLAREAGAATIFVLGGDGTFNEVLNGCNPGATLGFLPAGGTNVLPRALGLPRDAVDAARALQTAGSRRISLGRVNGRRFAFACGVGLDAELLRRAGRTPRGRRRSDLGVVKETLGLLVERRGRFDPALEVRGHGEAAFVLVANADPYTFVGPKAVHLTRGAAFELGLDFVAPRRLRLRDYPAALRYVAGGGGRLELLRGHD